MLYVRKIKGVEPDVLKEKVHKNLIKAGYSNYTKNKGKGFKISDIRLSKDYIKKYGRNISPYSGRRGNILGWKNWVEVNNIINKTIDSVKGEAKVSSLKDRFMVRDGKRKFHESDWDSLKWENIGSVMNPVPRAEAWYPEKEKAYRKLEGVV